MTTLVGYIPTPAGEAALTAAIDRAAHAGSPLIVLNIVRDSAPEDVRHATAANLEFAAQSARRAGVRDISTRTVHIGEDTDIAETLIAAAEEFNADTIVIGARREHGEHIYMLGVTTQGIVATAGINVLVV